MQNGCFKWALRRTKVRRTTYTGFVRRVLYGTVLIKGDFQSDEMGHAFLK